MRDDLLCLSAHHRSLALSSFVRRLHRIAAAAWVPSPNTLTLTCTRSLTFCVRSVRFGSFVRVCVRAVGCWFAISSARSLSIASACPLPPPLLLVPPPTRACVQCRSQHGRFATLVRHPYAGKYPGFAGHRCHGSMSRSWLVCARRSLVGADRRGARVANRMVSRSSTNEPRRFSSRRRSLATSSRKCRWSRPSTRAHSPRSRRSPPRRRRRTPRSRRGALLAAALYARPEPGKRVPHSPTSIVSCFRCAGGCARELICKGR